MKMSKALKGFVDDAREGDSYWVESAKLQFALCLERQRRTANMTYKSIAEKIGTSAAYITKIFRGDTNMTIESMVKLARATGGRLDIRIVDAAADEAHWDVSLFAAKTASAPTTTPASAPELVIDYAANDHRFALAA
jgi:transcriptional regulator with XRE-family HTH domain